MSSADLHARLAVARDAVEALGPALMALRRNKCSTYARNLGGDPYKTSVDRAAEAWVVEYLMGVFPGDAMLAEEAHDQRQGKTPWVAPAAFWTVDALDGTASFVDGFDGFCIQAAFIRDGVPVLGVIHEPARRTSFWAIQGEGAYRQTVGKAPRRLFLKPMMEWPRNPVLIDSTPPQGIVGKLMTATTARFLECGSTGVKIARVACGQAHLLVKSNRYKLWDVAPGDIILAEAGGGMSSWTGPVDYSSVYVPNLLAAPRGLLPLLAGKLAELA